MRALAIVILVIGLFMSVSTGIQYVSHKKVADLGPIEITKEEKHTPVYWSPWTGMVLVAVGAVLLLSNKKDGV
jgi:hypothetical protein